MVPGTGHDPADAHDKAGSDGCFRSDSATDWIDYGDLDADFGCAACDCHRAAIVETLTLLNGGIHASAGPAAAIRITGKASHNHLTGLGRRDTPLDGLGDDAILAANQHGDLSGDDGDQILTGGAGRYSLTGCAGADALAFGRLAQTTPTPDTLANVTDFTRHQDLIDLRQIDALANSGSAAFGGVAGQLRLVACAGDVMVALDAALRLNRLTAVRPTAFCRNRLPVG